jgi:SulP family sulfate permease
MEEAILDLNLRGVTVLLTGVQPQPYDMLRTIDIVPDLLPEEQIFKEFNDSIDWLRGEGLIKSSGNGSTAQ